MKSSFKKQYDAIDHPDGSVTLEFRHSRLSVLNQAKYSFFSTLFFIIPLMFISVSISSESLILFILALILALPACFLYYRIMFPTRGTIVLTPEGIKFSNDKKQLALEDISNVGTMTETRTVGMRINESAYVYAEALGNKIPLTRNMSPALAAALFNYIKIYYKFS